MIGCGIKKMYMKGRKKSPHVGIEPAIFRLEVQRAIHYTTNPWNWVVINSVHIQISPLYLLCCTREYLKI